MKILIDLPVFPGFYNSDFECECEDGAIEDGKCYDDYNFDYADYNERVSKACCDAIETKLTELNLPCKIVFKTIDSPKYYNYTNDKIECEITFLMKDLKPLIKEYKNSESFKEYLAENFKSRSGFISFYEHDIKIWVNEYLKSTYENFDLCLSSFLTFYLIDNDYNHNDLVNENDVSSETSYVSASLINEDDDE